MGLAFADFYAPQFYNPNSNEQSECFKDYTLPWRTGSPLCLVAISYNLRKPEGSLYFVTGRARLIRSHEME